MSTRNERTNTRNGRSNTRPTATSSNKTKDAYNYAGKKTRPTLARPSAPARGARRPYNNRQVEFRKAMDLIRRSNKFDTIPTDAKVTDIHAGLAKVHVDYNSEAPNAYLWRGAIIDYDRMVVIKWGTRTELVRVADNAKLADMPEVEPKTGNKLYFSAVFDGSVVSVFKYKSTIYASTGRSLGVVGTHHPGALNIPQRFAELLPAGMLEEMFPAEVHSNVYYYDFILLDKGTLDVTKAEVAVPSLIFANRSKLSNVSGSIRAFTPTSELKLSETELYPTQPGFYENTARVPMPVAQSYMSGEVTGYPEAVIAVERDKSDTIVRMLRIEPESVRARHAVRGDVASVAVRLSEIIGDYDYDIESGSLIPYDSKAAVISLGSAGVPILEAMKDALYAALPGMRREDINAAYQTLNQLVDKLAHFYSIKKNPNHPAAHYWEEAQGKGGDELMRVVFRMDQQTIFHSLRWYKLI